ncbi:GntR family transcriptional regulator [Clostridium bowmanii]|uniref:GntR family transcriptional regulator n=1 Tax=Clostridium bowmanii TaxID=132925 RepID=UPI001C0E4CE6|nr:GntR family transcriptional regulator [Clostridium bowmanii]MBU3188965.1 GntR family transcriptional regulator [Clostridium bowmanii]MCA1073624.1 GntR family transcriptional regulator [Clostridium bowmanii]
MIIKIDFEGEIPIYVQLKKQIILGLAKGELSRGESLPSVRQMAEDIGINMHTVNKTYNELKAEGFISIDRRKGAVVNSTSTLLTDEYHEQLTEEVEFIIAEAYCRGITEEEFIKITRTAFKQYSNR